MYKGRQVLIKKRLLIPAQGTLRGVPRGRGRSGAGRGAPVDGPITLRNDLATDLAPDVDRWERELSCGEAIRRSTSGARSNKRPPMSMIGFPLLLIPLAICNIIIFLMPGVGFDAPVATVAAVVRHRSGRSTSATCWSGARRAAAAARGDQGAAGRGAKYVTDHLLSLLVFGGAVGRIRAAAAVRQLDRVPAGGAGAGGFPRRHRAAQPRRPRKAAPSEPNRSRAGAPQPAAAGAPPFRPRRRRRKPSCSIAGAGPRLAAGRHGGVAADHIAGPAAGSMRPIRRPTSLAR